MAIVKVRFRSSSRFTRQVCFSRLLPLPGWNIIVADRGAAARGAASPNLFLLSGRVLVLVFSTLPWLMLWFGQGAAPFLSALYKQPKHCQEGPTAAFN